MLRLSAHSGILNKYSYTFLSVNSVKGLEKMRFDRVKGFMDRLTSWIIPGNSIVIYQNNQKIFEYSSGFSDVEKELPMNGNELLNIYSCSKIATVTAALQLY